MPQTPNTHFNITNDTFFVQAIANGIYFVGGITKRGPVNQPDVIVTSWPQFLKLFGGYVPNSNFPIHAKRMLERGSKLRVARIGHYSTITNASTLTISKPTLTSPLRLTFSADLITANDIDIDITQGIVVSSMTQVPFNTDNDTTIIDIQTALEALNPVDHVEIIPGAVAGSNHELLVFLKDNATTTVTGTVTNGASQATMSYVTLASVQDINGNDLWQTAMKYPGKDYENVSMEIASSSNGDTDYFNLYIRHALEPDLNETYTNLKIIGNPNLADASFLGDTVSRTKLIDFTYLDLSSLTGQLRPVNGTYWFNNGSDGASITDVDYIGDASTKTGLHAFDPYDDAYFISFPELSSTNVSIAGSAYADSRQDLVYWGHLSNGLPEAADLITERESIGVDSYLTVLSAGGLKIVDPVAGGVKEISEVGDVLGISAKSFEENGVWMSFFGRRRGKLPDTLGVVNNFGTPAKFADRNLLANRQISLVINKDNLTYATHNFTCALQGSKLSYLNIVLLILYIKKALRPTLDRYLEEPTDIPTFLALFREVEPFLDNLVTQRAVTDYDWKGDQFAKSLLAQDLVINDPDDLDQGKYKVKLYLKTITPLQDILIDITLTPTAVDFSVLNQ